MHQYCVPPGPPLVAIVSFLLKHIMKLIIQMASDYPPGVSQLVSPVFLKNY